ncbi:MAG: SRPBCC family protein [Planctomycetes bacterium]|nr:SRPBCC family protein [Planctomycetota bacterium]
MRLSFSSKRKIPAPAENIYAIVSDPNTWPQWSTKVSEVLYGEGVFIGTIVHKGEDIEFAGQIVGDDAPLAFAAEIVFKIKNEEMRMDLQINIQSKGANSVVTEWVGFDKDMPFLLVWLIKWISRRGKTAGGNNLERLEKLLSHKQ